MSKVLLINGSPHADGNTAKALMRAEEVLHEKGVETEWFHLPAGPVRGCIACGGCEEKHRCAFNDDPANEIIEAIVRCDGVIIGSPVYFAGPNGALLALLDRVFYAASAHGRLFRGKPAAALVTLWRGGSTAALDRLHKYFSYSEMPIVTSSYWTMVHTGEDRFGDKTVRRLAQTMAELLKK